jgi:hypothetical protein
MNPWYNLIALVATMIRLDRNPQNAAACAARNGVKVVIFPDHGPLLVSAYKASNLG